MNFIACNDRHLDNLRGWHYAKGHNMGARRTQNAEFREDMEAHYEMEIFNQPFAKTLRAPARTGNRNRRMY